MGWLLPEATCAQCKSHAELHSKDGWLVSMLDREPCKACESHAENGCGTKS